jgi:quercetin dioxygenase-like cupin family protein
MKTFHTIALTALLAGSALTTQLAHAQAPGLSRLDLVAQDISIPGQQVLQVRVDFAKGAAAPKHSHPGEEVAFVLEGTLEYQINDNPPVTLQAGQSLFIPAGASHSAKNTGSGEARELATYIVQKGKQLVVIDK